MNEDKIAYLLSFLFILVDRAGGTLVIDHLSEYAASDQRLAMKLDVKNDRVILTAARQPTPASRN